MIAEIVAEPLAIELLLADQGGTHRDDLDPLGRSVFAGGIGQAVLDAVIQPVDFLGHDAGILAQDVAIVHVHAREAPMVRAVDGQAAASARRKAAP